MNFLVSFKSHIGNKTFKRFVDFESALNDFQKVRVILLAVIISKAVRAYNEITLQVQNENAILWKVCLVKLGLKSA